MVIVKFVLSTISHDGGSVFSNVVGDSTNEVALAFIATPYVGGSVFSQVGGSVFALATPTNVNRVIIFINCVLLLCF